VRRSSVAGFYPTAKKRPSHENPSARQRPIENGFERATFTGIIDRYWHIRERSLTNVRVWLLRFIGYPLVGPWSIRRPLSRRPVRATAAVLRIESFAAKSRAGISWHAPHPRSRCPTHRLHGFAWSLMDAFCLDLCADLVWTAAINRGGSQLAFPPIHTFPH